MKVSWKLCVLKSPPSTIRGKAQSPRADPAARLPTTPWQVKRWSFVREGGASLSGRRITGCFRWPNPNTECILRILEVIDLKCACLFLLVKLGEQGCVCTGGEEPPSQRAAESGVHDGGAGRTWFHHPPAAAHHAQPAGDRATHLRLALHQPGVPQGEVSLNSEVAPYI